LYQDHYFTGDSTKEGILRAALEIFATFGYKKTAMSDISDLAGVSRPTLYKYFKNKEAIFFAVTEGIHNCVITQVQLALESHDSLERNLTSAFKQWTRPFIDILFGLTHGQELIGAGSSIAANVSENALGRFQDLLSDCLKNHEKNGDIDLSRINQNTRESAEYLILCLNGLSKGKASEEIFMQRVSVLIGSFIASIACIK
jgi:AcrR family transcriptional regulator